MATAKQSVTGKLIGYGPQVDTIVALQASPHAPNTVLVAGPSLIGKTTVVTEAARRIAGERGEVTVFNPHPEFTDPADEAAWKKDGARGHMVAWLRRARMKPASPKSATAAVLLGAEGLSPDASQLLLKATEDGLPHVSFLLTASSVDAVPLTVRSRAAVVRLTPMHFEDLAAVLTDRGIAKSAAREYAVLSGGRPGLALRFAEDEELAARYRQWMRFIGEAGSVPIAQRSAFAAAWNKKEDANEILRLAEAAVRSRIVSGNADSETTLLARRVREATAMMRHNVSPQLALEYMLFALQPAGRR